MMKCLRIAMGLAVYVCVVLGASVSAQDANPLVVLRDDRNPDCSYPALFTPDYTHYQHVAIYTPDIDFSDRGSMINFTIALVAPDSAGVALAEVKASSAPGWEGTSANVRAVSDDTILVDFSVEAAASSDTVDVGVITYTLSYYEWLNYHGPQICFDSASSTLFPPEWDWAAIESSGRITQVDFAGPKCYEAFSFNDNEFMIPTYPFTESVSICAGNAAWNQVILTDPDGMIFNYQWSVISGPGTVDPWTGEYTFQSGIADGGNSYEVIVNYFADICPEGTFLWSGWPCSFTIDVLPNETQAHFANSFVGNFMAQPDVPLVIAPSVTDTDPCNLHFSYYNHYEDPVPPASIDPETGTFTFLGSTEDTATYYVFEVVEEAGTADTTQFRIYLWTTAECGDMNRDNVVDVSDLTWLVNALFLDGTPPIVPEAADVNCDGSQDISDLTALVSHLFVDQRELCVGCK